MSRASFAANTLFHICVRNVRNKDYYLSNDLAANEIATTRSDLIVTVISQNNVIFEFFYFITASKN